MVDIYCTGCRPPTYHWHSAHTVDWACLVDLCCIASCSDRLRGCRSKWCGLPISGDCCHTCYNALPAAILWLHVLLQFSHIICSDLISQLEVWWLNFIASFDFCLALKVNFHLQISLAGLNVLAMFSGSVIVCLCIMK